MPDEISYTTKGAILGWGYETGTDRQRIIHPQSLLLDPENIDAKKLTPSSKKPVDVVADYLSCLRKHTVEVLGFAFGMEFIEKTPINWVLTIPSVSISFRSDLYDCRLGLPGSCGQSQVFPVACAGVFFSLSRRGPKRLIFFPITTFISCPPSFIVL